MPAATLDIETLFRTYYARLCYFATRMTGDASLAEDLVQEACLNCWKARMTFTNEQVAKSYLYTSVRNACLNHERHLKVVKKHEDSALQPAAAAEGIIEDIVRAEVMGEVHAAIEGLPEGCRTVLKLAFFNNLKNDEIAEQLGISVNTVKTQKARALQLLRFRLDPLNLSLFLLLCRTGAIVS
jgi:RNA polymerase sigma-70 factor (family 1)